jgi:hypothetical protein
MSTKKTQKPKTVQEATRNLRRVEGERAFHVDLFGDYIAEREGYKAHGGLDAVRYYLIQKHHWLPRDVRSLNLDDLLFVLEEEMSGWHVPPEFRG